MKLLYPLTDDLLTLIVLFTSRAKARLVKELGVSLKDYVVLSLVTRKATCSVSGIAERLSISPSQASLRTTRLLSRGFLRKSSKGEMTARIEVTRDGREVQKLAEEIVWEECDRLLLPVETDLRELFDAGCAATLLTSLRSSFRGSRLGKAYSYALSFLHTELLITKATHRQSLSLNEFRILFALLQTGPQTSSMLCDRLVMSKATVSEASARLRGKGLVESRRIDGRTRALTLAEDGRRIAEALAAEVDGLLATGVRVLEADECRVYNLVGAAVVSGLRKGGSSRSS